MQVNLELNWQALVKTLKSLPNSQNTFLKRILSLSSPLSWLRGSAMVNSKQSYEQATTQAYFSLFILPNENLFLTVASADGLWMYLAWIDASWLNILCLSSAFSGITLRRTFWGFKYKRSSSISLKLLCVAKQTRNEFSLIFSTNDPPDQFRQCIADSWRVSTLLESSILLLYFGFKKTLATRSL